MYQRKDDTTRPDGRQDKKRKYRKEEGRDTELKNKKTKTKISISMSSWWAKDDTRDTSEGRDGKIITRYIVR